MENAKNAENIKAGRNAQEKGEKTAELQKKLDDLSKSQEEWKKKIEEGGTKRRELQDRRMELQAKRSEVRTEQSKKKSEKLGLAKSLKQLQQQGPNSMENHIQSSPLTVTPSGQEKSVTVSGVSL